MKIVLLGSAFTVAWRCRSPACSGRVPESGRAVSRPVHAFPASIGHLRTSGPSRLRPTWYPPGTVQAPGGVTAMMSGGFCRVRGVFLEMYTVSRWEGTPVQWSVGVTVVKTSSSMFLVLWWSCLFRACFHVRPDPPFWMGIPDFFSMQRWSVPTGHSQSLKGLTEGKAHESKRSFH